MKTNLGKIKEYLETILRIIPKIKEENARSVQEHWINDVQDLVIKSVDDIHLIDSQSWYNEKSNKFEGRNLLISLAPAVIGIVLIFLVFFWTYPMSYQNQGFKNNIAVKNDSISLMNKQLQDIHNLTIKWENRRTNYDSFEQVVDLIHEIKSISKNIRK